MPCPACNTNTITNFTMLFASNAIIWVQSGWGWIKGDPMQGHQQQQEAQAPT